jgi:glycogen debranching enzyme
MSDVPETPDVLEQAKAVLKRNDQEDFTIPAEGLYPHQWLWDSCFIAIGLRHINVDRAQKELRSLVRGQWSNGMLPHMIFDSSKWYNRDSSIWRSHLSLYSPDDLSTSGITQPPVLAEAVVKIGEKLSKPERRTWYQQMYPCLLAYHQWLFTERDPKGDGLVIQLHPYETGLDSTPPWIDQLDKHFKPWWATFIRVTGLHSFVNLFRRDTRHVPPGQRMDNLTALLYYDVIRKLRDKRYDIDKILAKSDFIIADLSFNSIFIRANRHLEDIAKTIGKQLPESLKDKIKLSHNSFEDLWDAYSSQYYSRNLPTNKLIKEPSIAALMPLYGGNITKERAKQLVADLGDEKQFATKYPIPSVPLNSKYFDPLRYWQGPMWINTNWMIIDGLRRYGYDKHADIIQQKSIEVVQKHGFYEYFNPLDASPAGAKNFSWTAALIVDMLSTKK